MTMIWLLQIVFYVITSRRERAHDNPGEKAVKNILKTVKVLSNVVLGTNRSGTTNANKDSKAHPIEVKPTSTNDKKLIMSEVSLLKGSGTFIKPKLMWEHRQKKSSAESSLCLG